MNKSSKHSDKHSKSQANEFVADRETIADMIEAEAIGAVKESRINNNWERKQIGKNRDVARRNMRRDSVHNKRKSNR